MALFVLETEMGVQQRWKSVGKSLLEDLAADELPQDMVPDELQTSVQAMRSINLAINVYSGCSQKHRGQRIFRGKMTLSRQIYGALRLLHLVIQHDGEPCGTPCFDYLGNFGRVIVH